MKRITPCLWFDRNAEEAAKFYVSIFKNSRITSIARYSESGAKPSGLPVGSVMTVMFELNGQEFMGLNGGPMFKFSEAVSFMIMCEDQAEIDRMWKALTADGGEESVCGWCKDRFGLSWQVVHSSIGEMMATKDPKKSERVMKAVLGMKKIDVAALRNAFDREP